MGVYVGPFQAIWDLPTHSLRRIVSYGERHIQYQAAVKELDRRASGGVTR